MEILFPWYPNLPQITPLMLLYYQLKVDIFYFEQSFSMYTRILSIAIESFELLDCVLPAKNSPFMSARKDI